MLRVGGPHHGLAKIIGQYEAEARECSHVKRRLPSVVDDCAPRSRLLKEKGHRRTGVELPLESFVRVCRLDRRASAAVLRASRVLVWGQREVHHVLHGLRPNKHQPPLSHAAGPPSPTSRPALKMLPAADLLLDAGAQLLQQRQALELVIAGPRHAIEEGLRLRCARRAVRVRRGGLVRPRAAHARAALPAARPAPCPAARSRWSLPAHRRQAGSSDAGSGGGQGVEGRGRGGLSSLVPRHRLQPSLASRKLRRRWPRKRGQIGPIHASAVRPVRYIRGAEGSASIRRSVHSQCGITALGRLFCQSHMWPCPVRSSIHSLWLQGSSRVCFFRPSVEIQPSIS